MYTQGDSINSLGELKMDTCNLNKFLTCKNSLNSNTRKRDANCFDNMHATHRVSYSLERSSTARFSFATHRKLRNYRR